jgi:plastocyanin
MLLTGAVGMGALGPVLWATASPAGAATENVNIQDSPSGGKDRPATYSPTIIRVNPGDRIIWLNDASDLHTVTSDPGSTGFDSGNMGKGQKYERRFQTAGTYTYHCEQHPKMTGTVEVGAPATTTTTTAPPPTTTTAPPTTTTEPPTTTTTEPPTTTTTAPRPAAGPGPVPPPAPTTAEAPPPPLASSSTTTLPPTTTTTLSPSTTVTSAPPVVEAVPPGPPPETPPSTEAGKTGDTGDEIPTAAGPSSHSSGKLDAGAVAMVVALVAVGAFAAWTLIRVRPGRV